jgi:hypothetical protein
MSIEFIFSEFNSKYKPNKGNITKYFRDARFTEYNEKNTEVIFKGDRGLYHMGDYQDWLGLSRSDADVAVAFDADLHIVSDKVKAIIPLVNKFGFCIAASGRFTVEKDTKIGADSDQQIDDSLGTGFSMCNAFLAINPKDERAVHLLSTALDLMRTKPLRGPLILWRAIWLTGIYPYILPQQWCVCQDLINIDDPIIVHGGDKPIREKYALSTN